MLWVAQFGMRGIGCDEFERKARRGSLVVDKEIGAASPTLALKGEEEASPGRPRRLAAQAGKQAACLHAHTRRCARGGRAGQVAGDPHRITVADPYPLFSVPLQNSAKT